MKIGQSSDNPITSGAAAQSAQLKAGQSATASATAAATNSAQLPGVAVTVSTLARGMNTSNRGQSADVDLKKVDAVRASIQQGTYKVNAEAIADKLLSNAQEMVERTRI